MSNSRYVAVVGLTLADGSRVEPGEEWPKKKIERWLVDSGKVRLVEDEETGEDDGV